MNLTVSISNHITAHGQLVEYLPGQRAIISVNGRFHSGKVIGRSTRDQIAPPLTVTVEEIDE